MFHRMMLSRPAACQLQHLSDHTTVSAAAADWLQKLNRTHTIAKSVDLAIVSHLTAH